MSLSLVWCTEVYIEAHVSDTIGACTRRKSFWVQLV